MSHAASRPSPSRTGPARHWLTAAVVIGGFVAGMYLLEAVDTVLGNQLDLMGVQPRRADGVDGILFAPVLHVGWLHLVANTVPLLVLGFLVLLSGVTRWVTVTAVVWLLGGMGTWLVGPPNTVHLGASVLVFGWLVYLLVRGFFSRRPGQIALGVVVLLVYGGALWGVLPQQAGVSWQSHLFGALGGLVSAWWLARGDRPSSHRAAWRERG